MLPVSDDFVRKYEGRLEDRGAWCKDLSCGAVGGTASSGMGQPLISERQVITNQPELIAAGRSDEQNSLLQQEEARRSVEEATIPEYLRFGISAEGFAEYLAQIEFLRKRSDEEVARILNYKGNEDLSETPERTAWENKFRRFGNHPYVKIGGKLYHRHPPDTWSRQELEVEFQLLARMPMLRYAYNPHVQSARYEHFTTNEKWIDEVLELLGELKLDAPPDESTKNIHFFNELWSLYTEIDSSGDRRIGAKEFAKGLHLLGMSVTLEQAEAIFKQMGKNIGNEKWIDEVLGELKLDAVSEMSGQNTFFSKAWFDEAEKVFPWFPQRGYFLFGPNEQETERMMLMKEFNWDRWWGVTGYDITGYIK
jgi:hypothetical protein